MERFVLVVLISLCSFTSALKYVITRRIAFIDTHSISHDHPDLVQISSPSCRDNGTTECLLMNGQRHSICQCVCNNTDGLPVFYESTFGFYNKTWKCEENVAIRRHSGCLLSLYGHSGIEPVLTIPYDSNTVDYPIVNATTHNSISVSEGKTCSLRADRSMYMKCNGEWEQLNSTLVTKRFRIQGSNNNINFEVVSSASSSYPLPSGRIIRLAVTCSDRPWESSQCFVVKVEGELECPVPPSPPAPTSLFHRLSSSEHSGTSTPVHVTSVTTLNPSKDSSEGRKAFSTGLIIGVTLSGVAVLVALLVLVVFMIKLRKRRFDNQKRKASNSALIDNKTYGEVARGGAQKPTHHAGGYADSNGLGSSADKLPVREEPLYDVPGSIIDDNMAQDEHVYDVLEELPPHGTLKNEAPQPDKDPPVYGTFNEPSKKGTSDVPRGYGNVLYDSLGDQ